CRCNLRCIMCYTDCFNSPEMIQQELSFPEIVRIMDEIHEAGCLDLTLTGGEPLARRDFLDIYTYAKQKGFLVTVFTNGTLVTEIRPRSGISSARTSAQGWMDQRMSININFRRTTSQPLSKPIRNSATSDSAKTHRWKNACSKEGCSAVAGIGSSTSMHTVSS